MLSSINRAAFWKLLDRLRVLEGLEHDGDLFDAGRCSDFHKHQLHGVLYDHENFLTTKHLFWFRNAKRFVAPIGENEFRQNRFRGPK